MGPAAAASHESALCMRGLPGLLPVRSVVSVGPGHTSTYGAIEVHRFAPSPVEHVTLVDGLQVTTLERALVDLTSIVTLRRLAWLFDELAQVHRVVTLGSVQRCLCPLYPSAAADE